MYHLSEIYRSKDPLLLYFTALWGTRQTENTEADRELYVRTTIRELVLYIFFIMTLSVCKLPAIILYVLYFRFCAKLLLSVSFVIFHLRISNFGWSR